ncbi:LamG domain-containing protein [Halosimplex aquaticum]
MTVDWRLRPGRPVLEFGGSGYVALDMSYSEPGALPEFSVSAWVKTAVSGRSSEGNWANLDFDRTEYFNLSVRGDDGRVWFATTGQSDVIHDQYSETAINDGQWHHLAVVYDGSDKLIYVDGEEDARAVDVYGGSAIGSGTTRYGFLGDGSEAETFDGNRNSHLFEGEQDETLLYERALNAEEVKRLWHGRSPDDRELIAYWRFDGEGDRLSDATGNGNHGTIRGDLSWGAGHSVPDPALVDVEVTDAFNRFARSATATLDDPEEGSTTPRKGRRPLRTADPRRA